MQDCVFLLELVAVEREKTHHRSSFRPYAPVNMWECLPQTQDATCVELAYYFHYKPLNVRALSMLVTIFTSIWYQYLHNSLV